MYLLDNVVRDYPWGSTTVIPELLGRPADGTPQAELWIGAHPDAPSRITAAAGRSGMSPDPADLDHHERTLPEHVAADPVAALGPEVAAAFDGQLPLLLKVLAVEEPLSLQVHPSREQAKAGYAAEEDAGVDPGAPERTYGDDNHKPELLWAVTVFDALSGFRPVGDTVELLRRLDVPGLRADVDALAAGSVDVGDLVERWLTMAGDDRRAAVADLRTAAGAEVKDDSAFALEALTFVELADLHPDDGGVLVATLLNRVRLQPGEAIFSPAGSLHAYLHGAGIELMASSDNVLRGGLTAKHVDVDGLLAVLDREPGPPVVVPATPTAYGEEFRVPVPDFLLTVLRPGEARTYELPTGVPQLLLALEGAAMLSQDGTSLELPRGTSVFVAAAEPAVRVTGSGVVVRATVGD